MKKGKLTAEMLEESAWCAALAAVATPTDIVPPGWHTARQISKRTKTPIPTVQGKLKLLVASGKAERKLFRVQLEKNTRPVPHYKLK
jgi:hypothetical protein